MASSSQTTGSESQHVITASGAFLARLVQNAWTNVRATFKTLQIARMMATLSSMSDHQLDQIGISRSDIPKYAERLMADE